jgi:hypothetical protein
MSNERVRVVMKTVMRLIENVIQNRRLVAIARGKQLPDIQGAKVGQRGDETAVAAEASVCIEPLEVE